MMKPTQQPLAKKSRAARQEEPLAPQELKFRRGLAEDMSQIAGGKREEIVL